MKRCEKEENGEQCWGFEGYMMVNLVYHQDFVRGPMQKETHVGEHGSEK